MAERRMFSKTVTNSARFLRIPSTARLLYYDLGMAADDDGVVEAFTVMRTTGAAEDDLRVLAAKGFVRILNKDLVSFITDWRENNWIRADRKRPSVYADLLESAGCLTDKCQTYVLDIKSLPCHLKDNCGILEYSLSWGLLIEWVSCENGTRRKGMSK